MDLLPEAPDRPPTAFESRVFEATSRIPKGRVTTYLLLAKEIRCGSSRAVGQALRRNPFAPEVPCHRVISSSLGSGGYAGKVEGEKLAWKLKLLREEGIEFEDGRLSDPRLVYDFSS
ncbi:MAG: MGMT family protein [Verrucomicrobiota bacterium]